MQRLQALDLRVVTDLGAHVDDVVRLIIEDLLGQAERGDVEAHQPAGARVLLVDHDLVAHGEEVIRDGERARSGADERDALAVPNGGRLGEVLGDVVAQVGGDALEPANGDRLSVDASSAACRFAGAVAGAAEDAREDVGFPVEEVGLRVATLGDQPEVLGHIGVRRAGPLAVDHFMVVVRAGDVGWTRHFRGLRVGATA